MPGGIKQVCDRVLAKGQAQPDDRNQRFYCEVTGWKSISHPNVVPFLGVSETLFPFCIINPWFPNGNILAYIRKNQGANRFQLVGGHLSITFHNLCNLAVWGPHNSLHKPLVVSNIYLR